MAIVTHDWAPRSDQAGLWQASGTTEWWWRRGDNQHYWAFSIRPRQANSVVEIVQQWTVSDNDLNQVEHFQVKLTDLLSPAGGGGGLLQFNVIKVEGP
jgi:hypothetical protein